MAIVNRVSIVIGVRRTTVSRVAKAAGVSYEAVKRLYDNTSRRLDFETLDKLCRVLDCDVCDLLQYTPDSTNSPQD